MNQQNEVDIKKQSTDYDVELVYYSDLKCENYNAKIIGTDWHDGRISLKPWHSATKEFCFMNSDPDRVVAIAKMMIAFAQMVKDEAKKSIDTSTNA